jgi:hypothetical protein
MLRLTTCADASNGWRSEEAMCDCKTSPSELRATTAAPTIHDGRHGWKKRRITRPRRNFRKASWPVDDTCTGGVCSSVGCDHSRTGGKQWLLGELASA